jgi:alcohol dehydrogenase
MAACVAWGAIGFAKAKPGDRCVVVGAIGAIGVMVLQFLASLGCGVQRRERRFCA